MVLYGLHDHDGVIDHQTDGEYQPKQRECVDRKTKGGEDDECSDERNRHGKQRDESGTPALQKDVDDQDHQYESDPQCLDDFMQACCNGLCGIQWDRRLYVRRVSRLQLGELLIHRSGRGYSVRSGQLIDGHARRDLILAAWDAVTCGEVIGLCSQLDARDVLQAQHRAVRVGANDDLAELLWGNEASLRAHRVGELLTAWNRFAADLSSG